MVLIRSITLSEPGCHKQASRRVERFLVKALILFALILAQGCHRQAHAQFIGFTSPQTNSQQAFTAVTGVGVNTFLVRNLGQNTHVFFYRDSSGNLRTVTAVIQASYDGTNFFDISDTAHTFPQGIVSAQGYYPLIRCRLEIISEIGASSVDGFYSGTSIGLETPRGLFNASALNSFVVADQQDVTALPFAAFVNPPNRSAGGVVIVDLTGLVGGTANATAALDVQISPSITGIGVVFPLPYTLRFVVPYINGHAMQFIIPDLGTDQIRITLNHLEGTAPTAGTFSIIYSNGPTDSARGILFLTDALSAPGFTNVFPVGIPTTNAVLSPGRITWSVLRSAKSHTVQLDVTGAPTTCTFELEGSLGDTAIIPTTWFSLSGSIDCSVASNRMFHVIDRPVLWIRGNLTALAGGTAPTVALRYLGSVN